ncbi:uncharacterized protein PV06_10958 [Exophiala oligosperma]|uniref:ubiquitinyl hydrolase 1 n=1 Tax=Exophiala oligosperma TaxID=215243 RepID=A0A0D2A931_9EURO|nr:uncharacterized protein PV06_10958 [Exophiala oligosperma]KIW36841.1 hypothetical protein PV06_10958 [Exophiala oligosperma]
MNNPPARTYGSPVVYDAYASQSTSYPTTTKVVSTIALLVLGYYALSFFDAWPSTIQRYCYESFVYLLPSRLLYIMQRALVRLGRLAPEEARFCRADFGNMFAKEEAVQRIFGPPQIPLVLHKVRSLSGVADYISLSNDVGPSGLGNWDNSCYQNSVLQGLASLPALLNFLQHSLEMCQRYNVKAETHEALVAFLEKLADSNGRKTTLWTPKVLKSMDSWQQQDAQEYFSRVLDAVEREASGYIKQIKKPSTAGLECLKRFETAKDESSGGDVGPNSETNVNESTVQLLIKTVSLGQRNPLDGMTAQALECKVCGYTEGLSLTQFNCLTLNMALRGASSVEDLMDEFTAPEEVEGVECEHCTKMAHGNKASPPTKSTEAETVGEAPKKKPTPVLRTKAKQITIGRLPKDLVIHINRSIFDEYGNQLKNTAPVGVPVKLDFLSRWCAPLEENRGAVAAVYDLKCIVTHYGRHENGHYVALGKRGKDWYSFNDEMVTKVSEEEVLRRGNGFMLFYELMPSQTEGSFEPQLAVPRLDQLEAPTETDPSIEPNSTTEVENQPADDIDSETLESQSTAPPSTQYSEDSAFVSGTSSPINSPYEAPDRETAIPVLKTAAGLSGGERHNASETPLISPL